MRPGVRHGPVRASIAGTEAHADMSLVEVLRLTQLAVFADIRGPELVEWLSRVGAPARTNPGQTPVQFIAAGWL
jgi:hypothetical protein